MVKNKLIIAAAGSGKTTHLVNEALKIQKGDVLITTFTEANEAEIYKKIIEANKCVPGNVAIQTWFSFLIQHGARPFRKHLYEGDIQGLKLEGGRSAQGVKELDIRRHYFTESGRIYSDKLSKFVIKCNKTSAGAVINRLSRIYSHIYIDEAQDLAGYDLEFLKLLFASCINILLVCDPRQGTFSTNNSARNKQYAKSKILEFFDDNSLNIAKDESSLVVNYRCVAGICEFSDKLFPDLCKTTTGNMNSTTHDGVFLVKPNDVPLYLQKYHPMQLRYSVGREVNPNHSVRNLGDSKGLTFDHVLIYPTKPFSDWIQNNALELAPTSRAKYYVGLTRARYSVGIVFDYHSQTNIKGVQKFIP
ncbi:MAG: UvrD-helicase domain-containing protein [Nitrospirae bacterium]|nr:UvrD-helicase domain-containing protein [Nitrospirota bacterium]